MLNVNKITSELSMMPDPALQQFAQMHKADPYMLSLAVAESNRRKDMRMAPQMAAGQPPKVAEQAIAGMAPAPTPENTGIGRLPAQNMQRMAGGGIVAFADGGETDDSTPWYMRPADETIPNIPELVGEQWRNFRRWQQINAGRSMGAKTPGEVRKTEPVERVPVPSKEAAAAVEEAAPEKEIPKQLPQPDETTGLAMLSRIRGGAKVPSVTAAYKPESFEEMSAKVEQAAAGRNKETEAAYAPYLGELAKERQEIGGRDNVKEALIRAGLGMLGGTSPFAMVNIGKGGVEGLDAYQKAKAADAQAKRYNMQSQVALMQAQRAERSGNLHDATSLYGQARQDANTAAQLKLQADVANQRAAEMEQEMRLRSVIANKSPELVQLADRVRVEKNIPFSEALQFVLGAKQAPKSEADLRKQWSSNITLQQQFPDFNDYAAAVGATMGGTGASPNLQAAAAAELQRRGLK